ncbi:MAG: hypothetical protein P8Z31_01300 [Gammaproteobacteria bacterium]|jgi:Zn-dependent protease with chaperone function
MRNLVVTLLLVLPLQLAAQGAEQSLSQTAVREADRSAAQKQQETGATWFGQGYESRLDEEDRDMFESNASRSSVFSSGPGAFTSPSSTASGRGGGR